MSETMNSSHENIAFISVPRNLRYCLGGNVINPKKVLFALHGYGQLVPFFIRKFEMLSEDLLIVAPEGPHRFYLQGSSGRVGASWMTKEEREVDIQDNVIFLDLLRTTIEERFPNINDSFLLGFSQGGATAARWQALGKKLHHALILWASVFPPDLKEVEFKSASKSFFILGNEDEYYPKPDSDELLSDYEQRGFEVITYQGKHDINNEVLREILTRLSNIA